MDLRRAAPILPNLFTLASLFCGFYAISQSFGADSADELYGAALAILFGAGFDACDGRVARWTGTSSALGIELDSLCDLVTFGVAPASIVYNWGLYPLGTAGLAIAFVWVAAAAFRLARFNVSAHKAEGKPGPYILGLPVPMAASVIVALVALAHHAGGERYLAGQGSLAVIVLSLSFLMISTVRFRSFKTVSWRSRRTAAAVTLLVLASAAVWIGLQGAYVFVFLLGLYILLGITETLLRREREPAHEHAEDAPEPL